MAQKKQTPLTPNEKTSIALKAQYRERIAAIAEEADRNLQLKPTETWRTLTEEHKEVVLYRCYGGDSVKKVCEDLGISPGLINMAAYRDPEGFGKELAIARENGAHTQADSLLDIPFRNDMSDASKKLLADSIKWLVSRRSRDSYTEHQKHDHTVQIPSVALPSHLVGRIIEAKAIERKPFDGDPDEEE